MTKTSEKWLDNDSAQISPFKVATFQNYKLKINFHQNYTFNKVVFVSSVKGLSKVSVSLNFFRLKTFLWHLI